MTTIGTGKNEKVTLLVVEDEPALADIYTTKLKAAGFEVINAYDGVEGLEQAIHGQPGLILLDLILPLKDGFEVLRDLKQNASTKDIPVIIMTNLGQDFEIKRGLDLGAEQFLVKTAIDPSILVAKIQEVLEKIRHVQK